jgi:hypothetical protein
LALFVFPSRAADWGPFVEKVLEHLALHMSKEAAERIVESVTQGHKIPVLQLTDQDMKKLIGDYVAKCAQRAKWLDDNNPQFQTSFGNNPVLSLEYARAYSTYRDECGQGPKAN